MFHTEILQIWAGRLFEHSRVLPFDLDPIAQMETPLPEKVFDFSPLAHFDSGSDIYIHPLPIGQLSSFPGEFLSRDRSLLFPLLWP